MFPYPVISFKQQQQYNKVTKEQDNKAYGML